MAGKGEYFSFRLFAQDYYMEYLNENTTSAEFEISYSEFMQRDIKQVIYLFI